MQGFLQHVDEMMMEGGEGRARLQCQVQPVTHALHPAAQNETNCQLYWHLNCTGTSTVLAPERRVADPHHFDTDPDADSDPACHFQADPDPDFHFDADSDPDPSFHCGTDPNPDPTFHFDADPDRSFQLYLKLNCTGTSTLLVPQLY